MYIYVCVCVCVSILNFKAIKVKENNLFKKHFLSKKYFAVIYILTSCSKSIIKTLKQCLRALFLCFIKVSESYGRILFQRSVFTLNFEDLLTWKHFFKRYVPEKSYVNASGPFGKELVQS